MRMKKMKWIAVLPLALAIILAACGGTSSTAPGSEPAQTEVWPEEMFVEGEVTDATMNTLTVQLQDGTVYTFSTMDVEVDTTAGDLLIGARVQVYYTGELAGGEQVQTVPLTRVVVL